MSMYNFPFNNFGQYGAPPFQTQPQPDPQVFHRQIISGGVMPSDESEIIDIDAREVVDNQPPQLNDGYGSCSMCNKRDVCKYADEYKKLFDNVMKVIEDSGNEDMFSAALICNKFSC